MAAIRLFVFCRQAGFLEFALISCMYILYVMT
jgi:hypothetical protein